MFEVASDKWQVASSKLVCVCSKAAVASQVFQQMTDMASPVVWRSLVGDAG